jgi:rhodanese-related sulfurtransferase
MSDHAERIDARQAHADVAAGALLVCAYDDDEKWRKNRLDGAIPLADFRAREASLPKDQEIIFYCA